MRRAAVSALVLTVAVAGCRGRSAAPDGRDFAHATAAIDRDLPSLEDLARLTYTGIGSQAITLRDGAWAPPAGNTGEFTGVRLSSAPVVAGDVTGNGRDEAVVVLEATRASGPPRSFVAVVASSDTHLTNIATAAVGDGVRVTGGQATLGTVTLDVERPAAAGATRLTFRLDGPTLRLTGGDAQP